MQIGETIAEGRYSVTVPLSLFVPAATDWFVWSKKTLTASHPTETEFKEMTFDLQSGCVREYPLVIIKSLEEVCKDLNKPQVLVLSGKNTITIAVNIQFIDKGQGEAEAIKQCKEAVRERLGRLAAGSALL